MPAGPHTRARELPFATTTYEADEDEVLRAVLPSRCVYATGEQTCAIFVDHYRERKTGPCFAVAVVGCRTHRQGRYTLYPPGHYPYGRAAVAPYSATGQLLLDPATGQPPWEATLFAAAQDAKKGDLWPAEVRWFDENDDAGRRGTQGRHLEVAGRLTGVHRQLEQRQRERIAVRLGVATLTLIAGARRWGRSLQSRGEAILEVLAAIPIGASLLDRLLAAGALSGLWNSSQPRSAPQRWDALRGSWVIAPGAESARSACEPVERRAAVAAQQRAPPHTSSLHPGAEPRSTVGA